MRTDDPGRWWYRLDEPGLILGEDRYLKAIDRDMPLKVFESPVSWLRGDCEGTCFLDDCEARWAMQRYAKDDAALRDWWREAS